MHAELPARGAGGVRQRDLIGAAAQGQPRGPSNQNLSWRLIWSLLHQPVWFGGILAICIGFLLQATALGFGQLATVEPILVLELPLTLILASRVFGQGMRWRDGVRRW